METKKGRVSRARFAFNTKALTGRTGCADRQCCDDRLGEGRDTRMTWQGGVTTRHQEEDRRKLELARRLAPLSPLLLDDAGHPNHHHYSASAYGIVYDAFPAAHHRRIVLKHSNRFGLCFAVGLAAAAWRTRPGPCSPRGQAIT